MADVSIDPSAPAPDDRLSRRRAEMGGGGLRGRAARGAVVNALYLVSVNGLTLVQGLLIARLLGAGEYGLWGLIGLSFGTLFALAAIGFDDKYIQQDHPNQRHAFEIAFTLQSMLVGLFTVIALIAIPLFTLLYDEPRILVPGLLLALTMPLIALQTPMWVFYRRMDFVKQRLLQSLQPLTTFVVTVTLAVSGVGFWSLVIGTACGSIVTAAVAVRYSPYALRFRYERGALREYGTFSGPLFLGSISLVLMFQVPITIAAQSLGAAAVGAITLASQLSQYTKRVDDIVTHAVYPAMCAARDHRDLLLDAFTKSNRLAILWGLPVGLAAALFAPAAVPRLLGNSWEPAVLLVQVLGVSAALDQIGFNWTALARARAETTYIAAGAVLSTVAAIAVSVPLMLSGGLSGFAFGMLAAALVSFATRMVYLCRLFPARLIAVHTVRSFVPALPAVAVILGGRALLGYDHSVGRLAAEIAIYAVIVCAATWLTERPLLREMAGYLRRRTRGVTDPAPAQPQPG